jgi:ThiF family
MSEPAAQYGRVKGASWFPLLYKKDIMILGQGGISSWVSLLISRIGSNLHTFDMDIFEEHNMTGQIVSRKGLGMNKAEAVKEVIADFSPDCEVYTNGEYTQESPTNHIVICGFDNMAARKLAFGKWGEMMTNISKEEAKNCFFQDGRLLAEQLQIFNIPGDRFDLMEKYKKEHLPDDSQVMEAECTFKQTSHCAAMIASHMVGFLTNWVSNLHIEHIIKAVPFFYEYLIPINYSRVC